MAEHFAALSVRQGFEDALHLRDEFGVMGNCTRIQESCLERLISGCTRVWVVPVSNVRNVNIQTRVVVEKRICGFHHCGG
jgi:hypothetical protein